MGKTDAVFPTAFQKGLLFNFGISVLHGITICFRGVEDVAPYKKSKAPRVFCSFETKKHFRVWFKTTFVGADVLDGPPCKRLLTLATLIAIACLV